MKFFYLIILWIPLIQSTVVAQNYQKYSSHSSEELLQIKENLSSVGNLNEQLLAVLALQQKVKFEKKDSLFTLLQIEAGQICYELEDYQKALDYSLQAVQTAKTLLGERHPLHAKALHYVGYIHNLVGDYDEAIDWYTNALQIAEQATPIDSSITCQILINLSDYYAIVGNSKKALSIAHKAFDTSPKTPSKDNEALVYSLNNLGRIHYNLLNYEKALDYHLEAQAILDKYFNRLQYIFSLNLNDLAILYYETGQLHKSLKTYLKVKAIDEEKGFRNTFGFSILLNNMALVYKDLGAFDKALNQLEQALKIELQLLGHNSPELSSTYNNIAFLHEDLKHYDQASYYYSKALELDEEHFGTTHPSYLASLVNVAGLHSTTQQYKKALSTLDTIVMACTGISISNAITPTGKEVFLQHIPNSTGHINILIHALTLMYNILDINSSHSDKIKQSILAELLIHLNKKLINKLVDNDDKIRILKESHQWLQKYLTLLEVSTDMELAFAASDLSKSVLLLQAVQAQEHYHLGNIPDSIAKKEQYLYQRQSEIEALLLEKRPLEEKKQLHTELIEVDIAIAHLENDLEKIYPKYHQIKYKEPTISPSAIQANLDEQTALIEYVLADTLVHIFYIDKQHVQWTQVAVNSRLLHKRINSLRRALSDYDFLGEHKERAYKAYTKYAHWFYKTLLAPALKEASGINNLILVPDGELGHIPFEIFLVEEAPQNLTPYKELPYLLNNFNISYNYSAALWKENINTNANVNNGQIFGVAANYGVEGATSYTHRRSSLEELRKALIPLPNARKEVEALAANFEGVFLFDEQACERVVKEKVSDFSILHFATHGILNHKAAVLSALALTENGDSTETNFWQAYEISKLDLKADLVVLSACETGFGKFEQGNGIASLARSFMYAGAPSLVVSLWQVNDYATSHVMKEFYKNISKGLKKDVALSKAKQAYINSVKDDFGHPSLWSPFIQIGNTSSVSIIPKKKFPIWWSIFVGMGVVVGGGLFLRKRPTQKAA